MNIPLISLSVTVVLTIGGAIWNGLHTARRIGRHETEFDQMKSDVKALKEESVKHAALGTAIQLLTQSVTGLERMMGEIRTENREGRQEMKDAVAELKSETREALAEMRQDIRSISRTG
ncbi:MAG TPA: hypothetical protein VJP88_08555 [Caulobacteraceae bacterium]|nr:hypothetical protein [Caulobacteraceae bacterium]